MTEHQEQVKTLLRHLTVTHLRHKMPPMTNQNLIGVSEAADRLNVSARTVMRWAKAGDLPTVAKLPGDKGAYIFELLDVEAFGDARKGAS